MKTCSKCLVEKKLEEFHLKAKSSDGRQSMCRECRKLYIRQHYLDNKDRYAATVRITNSKKKKTNREVLIQYLTENPCVDCGNSDIEVLQFDHRDRELKSGEISKFLTSSTKKMLEEVAKCDVRCANCHVKRTRRQLGWWTTDALVVQLDRTSAS